MFYRNLLVNYFKIIKISASQTLGSTCANSSAADRTCKELCDGLARHRRASLFRYSETAALEAQASSGIKKETLRLSFCARLKRRALLVHHY